jgi:hypothetical protein
MEPARKPNRHPDPFATRPRQSRSWIEMGHCVDRGVDVACELVLSELSFAITMLHTASTTDGKIDASRLRKKVREIHDAAEYWLPRLGLDDARVGRVSARLCELRWRLESAGETF